MTADTQIERFKPTASRARVAALVLINNKGDILLFDFPCGAEPQDKFYHLCRQIGFTPTGVLGFTGEKIISDVTPGAEDAVDKALPAFAEYLAHCISYSPSLLARPERKVL